MKVFIHEKSSEWIYPNILTQGVRQYAKQKHILKDHVRMDGRDFNWKTLYYLLNNHNNKWLATTPYKLEWIE